MTVPDNFDSVWVCIFTIFVIILLSITSGMVCRIWGLWNNSAVLSQTEPSRLWVFCLELLPLPSVWPCKSIFSVCEKNYMYLTILKYPIPTHLTPTPHVPNLWSHSLLKLSIYITMYIKISLPSCLWAQTLLGGHIHQGLFVVGVL